ncbi:hypothetical protein KHQ81_05130 [Mycoplasmatota bacterium]|nr:hypothetical protein KHQ81_05130 [Mycoplasmatota bacterium]
MGLIKCSECKKQYPIEKEFCSNCGCPTITTIKMKKKNDFTIIGLIFIVLGILLLILAIVLFRKSETLQFECSDYFIIESYFPKYITDYDRCYAEFYHKKATIKLYSIYVISY